MTSITTTIPGQMPLQTNVIGPIELYDTDKSTEKTVAQIYSNPVFDSRVYPNNYPLSYQCIRELRKDPTIQLARWCILSQMIHTPWVYLNFKGKATNEMLDFVELNLLPLRDLFLQQAVFGTLDFGWSPFEVVYKPEDGQVWIDNFKALLHDYTDILVYINNGKFAGFVNQSWMANGVIIEEDYALNTNFDVEGTDWYGTSVFHSLFKIMTSWDAVQATANRYDLKIAGASWVVYYPVGKTPFNGTPTDNGQIAKSILSNLEASGGVVVPDEIQEWLDDAIDKETKGKWRIEILSADSSSQASFIDRQKYLDALKMRAFALTERSLLEGSHGTKAEADVHADVSLATIDSRHRLLCNALNLTVIPNLMRINYGRKYMWSVRVQPAPLVDNQFATIKSIYHALIQNTDNLDKITAGLDMNAMLTLLGLPTTVRSA